MQETSKCHDTRLAAGVFDTILRGEGIDIGCGDDPLRVLHGSVRPWDKPQGDAAHLTGVPDNAFDFVYSSHCLEHLVSVEPALFNWSRVLRSNGFLYLVVPDFSLYEKGRWPSRFNADHKHSFSLYITREQQKRATHWHVGDLMPLFLKNGLTLQNAVLQDDGMDYTRFEVDQTRGTALAQLCFIAKKHTKEKSKT